MTEVVSEPVRDPKTDQNIQYEEKMFLVAGIGTGLLCLGLMSVLFFILGDSAEMGANMRGVWIFGSLSLFNLLAMTKTVANLLKVRSSADQDFIQTYRKRTAVWGLAKLGSLGAFMALFWWIKENPTEMSVLGALAGMSTLLVVPVVGGLVWQKIR